MGCKLRAITIIVAALALCLAVYIFYVRETKKHFTVAVLSYTTAGAKAVEGMYKELGKYGLVEGDNLTFIYNGTFTDEEDLVSEAKRLVAMKPDIFYAVTTPATMVLKDMVKDTPIVFGPVNSPVKMGVMKNLKTPEANITGVTFGAQEPKRLEMLLEIAPDVKDILVPVNMENDIAVQSVSELRSLLSILDFDLHILKTSSDDIITKKLHEYEGEYDAIYIPTDPVVVSNTKLVADFALEKNIPCTTPHREGVIMGALFSYGFSVESAGAQSARIINQILKGAKISDIPVELADFQLTINLDTAEAIGVNVPDILLKKSFVIRN